MSRRKEMEDIIVNRKESVYVNGYGIIDSVANLPSEAELAKGNKEEEKIAKESIKARMAALKEELALLDEPEGTEEEEPRDTGAIDTSEEDARKADVEARAEQALKQEEARKSEEAKKVAAVKKAEEAKK
jgi:hypothetical protein